MFNEYPYTSFEKINLDWLLDLGKKLKEDAESGAFDGERGPGIFGVTVIWPEGAGGYANKFGDVKVGDFIIGTGPAADVTNPDLFIMKVTSIEGNYLVGTQKLKITGPKGEPGVPPEDYDQLVNNVGYILNTFVTPEMYGATGNGVTDDTNAFRSMLSSGAHIFVIPAKTYLTNNTLVIPENSVVFAYGAKIINTNKAHSVFEIKYSNISVYGIEFTENESYGRNDSNTSVFLIHSVSGRSISNVKLQDLFIHGTARYAINIGSYNSETPITNVWVENCTIDNVWIGVKQSEAFKTWITNTTISNVQAECITCDDGTEDSTITGCYLSNTHGGIGCIGMDTSKRTRVLNCILLQANSADETDNGITFNQHTGTNNDVQIADCKFIGGKRGVWCRNESGHDRDSINGLSINDCYFKDVLNDIVIDRIAGRGVIENNTNNNSDSSTYFYINTNYVTYFVNHYKCQYPITIELSSKFTGDFSAASVSSANKVVVQNGKAKFDIAFTKSTARVANETVLIIPVACKQVEYFPGVTETGIAFMAWQTKGTSQTGIHCGWGYASTTADNKRILCSNEFRVID